jgi:hypothetical protein
MHTIDDIFFGTGEFRWPLACFKTNDLHNLYFYANARFTGFPILVY